MKSLVIKTLASGFGTGYSPIASGTVGTLLAAGIAWLFFANTPGDLLITMLVLALSVPISTAAEKLYGKKDDSHITIDEVAGYMVSVLFIPKSLLSYAIAFILFRIFDVIKPLFVKKVQSWPAGWGIVADDFFAGLLANILLRIILWVV